MKFSGTAAWAVLLGSVGLDAAGAVLNSLGTFPRSNAIRLPGAIPAIISGRDTPLKRTIVFPAGDRIYVATGERFEVQVLDPEGQPASAIQRHDNEPIPLTAADLVRYFSGAPIRSRDWEAIRWSVPEHETLPAIRSLQLEPGLDVGDEAKNYRGDARS